PRRQCVVDLDAWMRETEGIERIGSGDQLVRSRAVAHRRGERGVMRDTPAEPAWARWRDAAEPGPAGDPRTKAGGRGRGPGRGAPTVAGPPPAPPVWNRSAYGLRVVP